MNYRKTRLRILMLVTVTLAWQASQVVTVFAQQGSQPALEKWRPKAGIYSAEKDFENQCMEFGDIVINLKTKSVEGHEWSCKITKLTDTAPGAIKLDMVCYDYNLADDLHFPEDKNFMETMLLKKQDEKNISIRKTLNGKFKDPSWQASYCPVTAQRAYTEMKARSKAGAEQKAAVGEKVIANVEVEQKPATEPSTQNPWRPQDGVYATPGANFEDRCLKAGDAVIDISERSISSGGDKCGVTFIRDETDALRLFATCGRQANEQGSIPSVPSPETIILAKIDDKTVALQKSKGGNFTDPATRLSFCGPDVQKMYAQQKAKK